jgi:hypothetical protein
MERGQRKLKLKNDMKNSNQEHSLIYLSFEKESSDKWYVVLPEWDGSKDDLEMVLGADTLLDIIAQGDNRIEVGFSTERFEGAKYILEAKEKNCGGMTYDMHSDLHNFEVWLCYVTKFVFGSFPTKLYIA